MKQKVPIIVIKNPRLVFMGNKLMTELDLFKYEKDQTKRLIEKALLSKSIIADIEIKEEIKFSKAELDISAQDLIDQ